jgi:hypothetical protein
VQCPIKEQELVAVLLGVDVRVVTMLDGRPQPRVQVPQLLSPRLVDRAWSRMCGDLGHALAIALEHGGQLVDRTPRTQLGDR